MKLSSSPVVWLRIAATLVLLSGVTSCVGGDDGGGGDAPMGMAGAGFWAAETTEPRVASGKIDVTAWSPTTGDVGFTHQGARTPNGEVPAVQCTWFPGGNEADARPALHLYAGYPELALTHVIVFDELASLGTRSAAHVDGAPTQALFVSARLSPDGTGPEYQLGSHEGRSSACIVSVGELSATRTWGTVSCRDLVPVGAEGGFGSASITFDCPIERIDAPPAGIGGGPGTGGGGTGGANSGGTGAMSTGGGGTGGSVVTGGRCTGSATPCSLRSESQCDSVSGCSWEGDCGGLSQSCYYQLGSYSCAGVDGCYWSTYYDDCQGSSWSCSTYSGEYSCEGQPGCNWDEDCEGVAHPCSSFLTALSCFEQAGCTWEFD